MLGRPEHWEDIKTNGAHSKAFGCGWCGERGASSLFFTHARTPIIYICMHCAFPTVLLGGGQTPGPMPGKGVANLPMTIEPLYREAREAIAAGTHTAAALVMRILLLRVAMDKGITVKGDKAPPFQACVDFLVQEGFVGAREKAWVDKIRVLGNAANHELGAVTREEALKALAYMEHLLLGIYDFPDPPPDEQG